MEAELDRIVSETQRSNRRYLAKLAEEVRRVREALPGIVQGLLRVDPKLGRVVLYGSLARGDVRSLDFDVDLAVTSDRIFKIAAWCQDQNLRIDVQDLETMGPDISRQVECEGVVLYEKPIA